MISVQFFTLLFSRFSFFYFHRISLCVFTLRNRQSFFPCHTGIPFLFLFISLSLYLSLLFPIFLLLPLRFTCPETTAHVFSYIDSSLMPRSKKSRFHPSDTNTNTNNSCNDSSHGQWTDTRDER